MSNHCKSEECVDLDRWGFCSCKCAPCKARKDIESDWAEIEAEAWRESEQDWQ